MSKKLSPTAATLVAVERYLSTYVTFPVAEYAFVGALWAAATYLWPHFDAFPYLVITSDTKRSGKTRFSEVLSFVSSNARNMAGMTAATLFRSIRDEQPTMFIDEAESLSSEAASMMRSVLNVGYRKGQTIPRMGKNGVEEWPAYCPKAFILIGDVYDTLRDRSIIIRMRRGAPAERFVYDVATAAGKVLGAQLHEFATEHQTKVMECYVKHAGLPFLPDRDEEIWMPLFAICQTYAPERLDELTRIAVDMATEKTLPARVHTTLHGAEEEAEADEYARRLLVDLHTVMNGARSLFTADALSALLELPTGPWRKFKGTGLTPIDMANLLSRFGVEPKVIRVGGKQPDARVARGYRRDDVSAAVKANGLG